MMSGAGMGIAAAVINNNGGQLSTVRGAGGDIVLTGPISNRAGRVLADGDTRLVAGNSIVNTGTIGGNGNVSM